MKISFKKLFMFVLILLALTFNTPGVTRAYAAVAGITVAPVSGLITTEAGGTAAFTIVLDTQPAANVVVDLSSTDTTEGTVSPASVIFTDANWNIAQTVTVTGVNDFVDDGDIPYTIVTATAASTDALYNVINPPDVSVTTTDNDAVGITVSVISGNTTEVLGTATFSMVLNSQPTASVSIGLSSNDTTEGTVLPATVTFTTVNWNIAQTVTVTGVNDFVDDGDIPYTIAIATATSTDALYNVINPPDVSVTNVDNDTAGITVSVISGNTTEAGGTATFTMVLNSQPAANVSVGLSSSDTTEGAAVSTNVTFTTANWSIPKTVTVTGVDDFVDDGDIAYTIITAAASSTDMFYNGMALLDVSATNIDNDIDGFDSGLIINGGFNLYPSVNSVLPTTWKKTGFTIGKDTKVKKEGAASIKGVGWRNTSRSLRQVTNLTGVTGDIFTFSFWVKGLSQPRVGVCRAVVSLYNGGLLVVSNVLNCPTKHAYGFQQMTLKFTAPAAYTKVVIKFIYSKPSGTVWFDAVNLTRP